MICVFLAMRAFPAAARGGYSSLRCAGFSLQCLLLLQSTGSGWQGFSSCGWGLSCGSLALECRLSSCGPWAQLPCGMWDLPGPGIVLVSLALAGRFWTTREVPIFEISLENYFGVENFIYLTQVIDIYI